MAAWPQSLYQAKETIRIFLTYTALLIQAMSP